jgi:hypothetical protein
MQSRKENTFQRLMIFSVFLNLEIVFSVAPLRSLTLVYSTRMVAHCWSKEAKMEMANLEDKKGGLFYFVVVVIFGLTYEIIHSIGGFI